MARATKDFDNARIIVEAFQLLNSARSEYGMDDLYLDNIKGIKPHIVTYGDARKIAKAKKYTTPIIDTGIMSLSEPNNIDILDLMEDWALDEEDDKTAIGLRSGVLLKVSPKLIAIIVPYMHKEIDGLKGDDTKSDISYIRQMLTQVVAPKAAKAAAAPKAPKADKKDEAKKAKIAETKELIKELKKDAKEAKKAADAAQKNLEKAEKALAKLVD